MQVIHLSVECFPVAKVGGLADVVGSLPKYLCQLGIDASVIMPFFDRKFTQDHQLESVAKGEFHQGSSLLSYEVLRESEDSLGFPLYLIRIPGVLDREEVYCYPDEAEQWIAFQHAVLHYLKTNNIRPDVLHCHDHHVGLLPFLIRFTNEYRSLADVRTVFTVHNGQYQGWMSWSKGILLPAFDTWKWGLLDWDGVINPLATAIKCCDAYTTVSAGYLEELYKEANGLQALFYDERAKSHGIVNGIDTAYWDPVADQLIIENYGIAQVDEGKLANKKILSTQYGLDPALPLLSFIGRFATEKGADILADIIEDLLGNSKEALNIFILGSGDATIQNSIAALLPRFKGRLAAFFGYNEGLAHQVYAASDLLIMPSRVEPCGLNQLYALKYGTIPIVRKIGGLKDTVIDVEDAGYGFVFDEVDSTQATAAVSRALAFISNKEQFDQIREKAMELDFSWHQSAQKYIDLYNQLLR